MLVSDIFRNVSSRLQDLSEPRRWRWDNTDSAAPSLLSFINLAILEIVNNRPDATAITKKVTLPPGYRQLIPSDALSLINILCSYDEDGEVAGPVTQCKQKELQQIVLSQEPSIIIDSYAYDKLDDPNVFWVSPAVLIGSSADVEMTYSAKPVEITDAGQEFPLTSQYIPAVVNWMLYEIYSGDNNDTDLVRAESCYKAFYQSLGIKVKIDKMFPVKPKAGEASG